MSRGDERGKDPRGREKSKRETLSGEFTRGTGATSVDLGDDLIERTATLVKPESRGGGTPSPSAVSYGEEPTGTEITTHASGAVLTREQISDQMHSARILLGEGLLEDAKRVLRKVLLSDPSLVEARRMLEEIHETELKQIFGESDLPRPALRRREPTPVEVSADVVMRGLDRDLKLGIFSADEPAPSVEQTDSAPQLSLFKDRAAMERFGEQMDRDFGGRPAVERVDLGIAFLEMGLHDLAVRHFQAAVNSLTLEGLAEDEEGGESALAATALLAYALILGGRAFEATIKLQALLNDVAVERARKVDLIYLMGRAFEAMGKAPEARQWFVQAAQIVPRYRDTDERLKSSPKPRRRR